MPNYRRKTHAAKAPAVRPVRAVGRAAVTNSGYGNYGASRTKSSLIGWNSRGGSPREDIDQHLSTLAQRSRDVYMGVPLATGALKTVRTNVVGAGLQLQITLDHEALGLTPDEASAWARGTEREWKLWAQSIDCDIARQNTFVELQQLAMLSWIMSGDVFATLPVLPRPHSLYDLRVKLIEADRVSNPNSSLLTSWQQVVKLENGNQICQGVEVTPLGEVVAYHISDKHPLSTQFGSLMQWERVEITGALTGRRNILHLFNAERPEQYRGVPLLAPVIETLKQLGRYTEAELVAAVVSGMFTVFIKSNSPQSPIAGIRGEDEGSEPRVIHVGRQEDVNLGNGTVMGLALDESIDTANPGRPNTAFEGFITALSKFIGSALEIPHEVLLKHFGASYSASRAALMQFWHMCRMYRTWLAQDFCQPIYQQWLDEAVARGRVVCPGYWNDPLTRMLWAGATWNGPAPGHIQPLQEAMAAEKRMQLGITTGAQETMEANGGNHEDNLRTLGRENAVREEHGLPPMGAGISDVTVDQLAAFEQ